MFVSSVRYFSLAPKSTSLIPIRVRVIKLIERWIDIEPSEFKEGTAVRKKLDEFLANKVPNTLPESCTFFLFFWTQNWLLFFFFPDVAKITELLKELSEVIPKLDNVPLPPKKKLPAPHIPKTLPVGATYQLVIWFPLFSSELTCSLEIFSSWRSGKTDDSDRMENLLFHSTQRVSQQKNLQQRRTRSKHP